MEAPWRTPAGKEVPKLTIEFGPYRDLKAARMFFELSVQDASDIFLAESYDDLDEITPDDVVCRIDQILTRE